MAKVRRDKLRADRVIAFIEALTVPSGEGQGSRFKLRPWQVAFIRDIYEPVVENKRVLRRLIRRAILSIARKNGKTALIACLALCHLCGPESVQHGEVYSAANSREQAAQVFKVAAQIVRADPELSALLKVVDSTKQIACYRNGSFYKAVSAESKLQHGLNPSFVVYDELAQAVSRDLYDALDTSMGARTEPLFCIISTQSNDPTHILSELIDDALTGQDETTVCHLYEVPEDEVDVFSPAAWKMANPALGDFRSIEDMRQLAKRAQRIPSEEAKFRNLYLNQRVSPNTRLITRAEWKACAGNATLQDGEEVYLALDLSSVNDLSALALVTKKNPIRCKVWGWKPEECLQEHSNRDFGHGNHRYVQWVKQGYMDKTPGKVIHHGTIARKIAEIFYQYRVLGMAYDRHKIEYLMRELTSDEVGLEVYKQNLSADDQEAEQEDLRQGLKIVPWGQGFISMGPAVDAFETAIIDGQLVHPNNPLLNWNIANAVAVMDPAGNRKLDKEKSRFRIDCAQALVMAIGYRSRDLSRQDNSLDDFLKNAVMA